MQITTESNSLCSFRETQTETDVKNKSNTSKPDAGVAGGSLISGKANAVYVISKSIASGILNWVISVQPGQEKKLGFGYIVK